MQRGKTLKLRGRTTNTLALFDLNYSVVAQRLWHRTCCVTATLGKFLTKQYNLEAA